MFVVDTNILIYAADRDSEPHERCRSLVEAWRAQASAWYLTWGIAYEFMRVTTHPRVFRAPWSVADAWSFLGALLRSPSLGVLIPTDRHGSVLGEVIDEMPSLRGNLVHDARTAVLMREHGVRTVYTRDADFHRFGFLEVVDPTA
ncbi:MAG: TA system VapC family ribonuclease toxin [Gemmatimonadota bacterium]